jgi:hypothetical protein
MQEFQIYSPKSFREPVSKILVEYFEDLELVVLHGFCERQTSGGKLKEGSPLKTFINLPADIAADLLAVRDSLRACISILCFVADA